MVWVRLMERERSQKRQEAKMLPYLIEYSSALPTSHLHVVKYSRRLIYFIFIIIRASLTSSNSGYTYHLFCPIYGPEHESLPILSHFFTLE